MSRPAFSNTLQFRPLTTCSWYRLPAISLFTNLTGLKNHQGAQNQSVTHLHMAVFLWRWTTRECHNWKTDRHIAWHHFSVTWITYTGHGICKLSLKTMWMFRKDKSYSMYNFKVLIQRCVTCIYQRLVSGCTLGQRPLVACSWMFLPSPHCLSLMDVWCCCKTGQGRNLWAGEKLEKIHIKKKEGSSGRGRESTLVNNCTKLFFVERKKSISSDSQATRPSGIKRIKLIWSQ